MMPAMTKFADFELYIDRMKISIRMVIGVTIISVMYALFRLR